MPSPRPRLIENGIHSQSVSTVLNHPQKHKYHHDCKDKCCKNQSEYNTFHEQTGHLFVMSLFSLPYPVHSFQMPDSDASFLFCHSHVLPLFCEVDSCLFPALLLSVGMLFSVQSLATLVHIGCCNFSYSIFLSPIGFCADAYSTDPISGMIFALWRGI